MHTLTRRGFLRSALGSAVVLCSSASPLASISCSAPKSAASAYGSRHRVLADLHVHPMLNAWLRRTPIAVRYPILSTIAETEFNPTKVSWQRCHEAGVDLMCAAHFNLGDEWLSMPTVVDP